MTHSVLGSISLGYQLLWDRLRQLQAVELSVDEDSNRVDAAQLLQALDENWSGQAPSLLLAVRSPELLADVLDQVRSKDLAIEVSAQQAQNPALAQRVHQAHQRGVQLIWHGDAGLRPSTALAPCFAHQIIVLTPQEALGAMRVSLHKHSGPHSGRLPRLSSPVQTGQIYEAVASRVVAEHCLDDQGAWAVAGWPMEDVLHGYRRQRIQPHQGSILGMIEAIDADDSLDGIEHFLNNEPLLAYRFLRYANSAALGLRTEIESLRQGLMVLGHALVKTWLLEQLPHASCDLNLAPVRAAMVMRARLMAQLMNTGDGDELRREIYLCGLLSQVDLMLGEPLSAALSHLPVPQRVHAAILNRGGPYSPYLDIATALESPPGTDTHCILEQHQLSRESVNRALLRSLAQARSHHAKGLLLV